MFDEPASVFGRFRVTEALGDGRFGPVYLGLDPDSDQIVVIRTFAEMMTVEQHEKLIVALQQLCDSPLDHPSIAMPLAAGAENGLPYLAHSYLPGTSVDEHLRTQGPRPLAEVLVRVTHLAAAIDFAAAAGIHHGTLSPRDIIFAPHSTGVSGFGLVQALRGAGVDLSAPTRADDVYALAAMTFELLIGHRFTGGSLRRAIAPLRGGSAIDHEALIQALEPALSPTPDRWPATALAFAASLQAARADVPASVAEAPAALTRPRAAHDRGAFDVGRLSFGTADLATDLSIAPPDTLDGLETLRADAAEFDMPLQTLGLTLDVPASTARRPDSAVLPDDTGDTKVIRRAPIYRASNDPLTPRKEPEPITAHPLAGAGSRVFVLAAGVAVVVLAMIGLWLLDPSSSGPAPVSTTATIEETPASLSDDSRPASLPPEVPDRRTPRATGGAPVSPAAEPPPVPREAFAPPVLSPSRSDSSRPDVEAIRRQETRPGPPRPSAARNAVAGTRPAPQPPATRAGRVLVRSTPAGASVLVDGAMRGQTPAAIRDLPLGAHTIVVWAPGYQQWEQSITLTGDHPSQSFEVALDGASPPAFRPSAGPADPSGRARHVGLQIDSRPSGAQVWVDGAPAGVTPLFVPAVTAGAHQIRIELAGYRPWTTSVSVTAGEQARIAASLER